MGTTLDTQVLEDIEVREAKVKQIVGDNRLAEMQLDIDTMLKNGLPISISFYGGSLFTRKLNLEELGISSLEEKNARIKAGQKLMIPEHYVKKQKSIETRFRQAADKYTLDIEIFRPWRWLALDSYDDFVARWEELTEELEELKAEIIDNWDVITDETASFLADLAKRAWKSIQARYDNPAVVILSGAIFNPNDDPDAEAKFVEWVVSNGVSQMPTIEEVREKIHAEYTTAFLFTAADLLKKKNEELDLRQAAIDKETSIYKAETAIYQEEARREAILKVEMERAREAIKTCASPITEALSKVVAEIGKQTEEVLESIEKNGFIKGKVASKASGLSSLYKIMGGDVLDDDRNLREALDDLVARMQQSGADGQRYNTQSVVSALEKIRQISQTKTSELLQEIDEQTAHTTRASALEF